jgi:hypothetical protein
MRRLLLAAPLALCAYGDLAMADEPADTTPKTTETAAAPVAMSDVSDCVELAQEDVPAGIAFSFRNACEAPIRCEFSWSLRCDMDEKSGVDPRTTDKRFNLETGASRTFVADTAACGDDGWMIADDVWDCAEHS